MERIPDWAYWRAMPYASISTFAALTLGIAPPSSQGPWPDRDDYLGRVKVLAAWADTGELRPVVTGTSASESDAPVYSMWSLVDLAQRLGWKVPDQLLQLPAPAASYGLEHRATPTTGHQGPWPWGSYTTERLEWLAKAAEKFWARYDSTDPSTEPRAAQVEEYLRSLGASIGEARAIAMIINGRPSKGSRHQDE